MINLTIYGEPASKANSRRIGRVSTKGWGGLGSGFRIIKSAKALQYEKDFLIQAKDFMIQVKGLKKPLEGDLVLHCTIYYRTKRPDLDESLVMDCLQKAGIIENDRQIKEKHIYHGIDKENSRTEIRLEHRG